MRGNYGCVKNEVEGNKWIKLAAKNDENSPGSLCAQGICYEMGIGGVVIKNKDKAKECYTKAVEQGYIPALCELGITLMEEAITTTTSSGHTGGYNQTATHTHKDEEKLAIAVKLLTTASEAGYAPAIDALAYCYARGYGVAEDKKEAFKLCRMAAEKGSAKAKRNIGIFYEGGDVGRSAGIERNKAEAKKWFLEANAQGYDVQKDLNRIKTCAIL